MARIACVKGRGLKTAIVGHALVDDSDYAELSRHVWRLAKTGYAYRVVDGKPVLMHREILKLTDPAIEVDHRNRTPSDNQRLNLRVCSHAENQQNRGVPRNSTSGIRGVHWDNERSAWRAGCRLNGRSISFGRFASMDQAADAASRGRAQLMPFTVEGAAE